MNIHLPAILMFTGGIGFSPIPSLIPTCPIQQMPVSMPVSNMILSEITWGVRKCSPCTLWQQTCLANHMLQDVDSKCCTSVRLPKGNHCERPKNGYTSQPGKFMKRGNKMLHIIRKFKTSNVLSWIRFKTHKILPSIRFGAASRRLASARRLPPKIVFFHEMCYRKIEMCPSALENWVKPQ